jgi:Ca2+-transporting ATPase
VVILVNAVFAFVQESRAERASEALRRILPRTARVRRRGEEREISAEELGPGDVVILTPGDRISADAEVVSRHELRVDNSTLTGESRPVEPERPVYAGTHVARGRAEAVVVNGDRARQDRRADVFTQRGR